VSQPIRILIIEDEPPAVKRLSAMLERCRYHVEIVDIIDTVHHAVSYLSNFDGFDLIISDIQLADGISFEIFSKVKLKTPVIFATAYDEYMLQAFKVNSIEYLLKPFDEEDLEEALTKYQELFKNDHNNISSVALEELLKSLEQKKYKERFLVKKSKELVIVPIEKVAYFYTEDGYVHLVTHEKQTHIVEFTLDNLSEVLPPNQFFRISRKFFISTSCIARVHNYFNSRLKLDLKPGSRMDAIVSREKVAAFKNWLDQ
jgi:two-component system response regulator LytT